jgi:hypothetical protein
VGRGLPRGANRLLVAPCERRPAGCYRHASAHSILLVISSDVSQVGASL